MPIFHGLHGRLALQGRLRQLVVLQRHMAQKRLLQILRTFELTSLGYIHNAPIEAVDHHVAAGCSGLYPA